jgi:hypothetical protein
LHLTGLHLTGLHLTGLHLTGLHLTGLHLTGLHLTGLHLTGIHLLQACISHRYVPELSPRPISRLIMSPDTSRTTKPDAVSDSTAHVVSLMFVGTESLHVNEPRNYRPYMFACPTRFDPAIHPLSLTGNKHDNSGFQSYLYAGPTSHTHISL